MSAEFSLIIILACSEGVLWTGTSDTPLRNGIRKTIKTKNTRDSSVDVNTDHDYVSATDFNIYSVPVDKPNIWTTEDKVWLEQW